MINGTRFPHKHIHCIHIFAWRGVSNGTAAESRCSEYGLGIGPNDAGIAIQVKSP